MIELNRKVILLLGGLDSLSTGIAWRLAEAGAEIVIGHEPDSADEATILAAAITAMGRSSRPAHTLAVNSGDQAALAAQVGSLDWIDAAVLSPGWFTFKQFMGTSPADWDEALARNFEQTVYAAQAVARKMIVQNNGGRMIFLSSTAALKPEARSVVAGTSLSALHVIARMAAVDLGPHRITCNVVAVGPVEAGWATGVLTDEGRAFIHQGIPAGRIGTAKDVGEVCCFLASDQTAYLTGMIIPVDGGFTLTKMEGEIPAPDSLKW